MYLEMLISETECDEMYGFLHAVLGSNYRFVYVVSEMQNGKIRRYIYFKQ